MTRCRLCSANDRDALAEEMAEALWQRTLEEGFEPDWQQASPFWRKRFRYHAEVFLDVLEHQHA